MAERDGAVALEEAEDQGAALGRFSTKLAAGVEVETTLREIPQEGRVLIDDADDEEAWPVASDESVPALVDPTNKLGNYVVTSNNGTLTITPAPLAVAAADATRLYGDPNNLSGTHHWNQER